MQAVGNRAGLPVWSGMGNRERMGRMAFREMVVGAAVVVPAAVLVMTTEVEQGAVAAVVVAAVTRERAEKPVERAWLCC